VRQRIWARRLTPAAGSKSFRTLAVGAIFSALAVSFASLSGADETSSPPQVIVKFADLHISTPQGAATLYRRIHGAADDVCSRMYRITEAHRRHKDACQQQLIANAVIRVNRPATSAVFASKYGLSPTMVLAAAGAR
jgi:UrcA family protein